MLNSAVAAGRVMLMVNVPSAWGWTFGFHALVLQKGGKKVQIWFIGSFMATTSHRRHTWWVLGFLLVCGEETLNNRET